MEPGEGDDPPPTVKILNVLGDSEWELVSVTSQEQNWLLYILKRPKQ